MSIAQNKLAQVDNWHFVPGFFMDFRKPFDTADQKLLTQILWLQRGCKVVVFITYQEQKAIC